ncbi:MAG: F0F1 ATP synthase subunit A [Phycisphaeraceae bacterium]|nr:F0F1 ATP synthase subunit A [Phycisphaeraceae bacterium]
MIGTLVLAADGNPVPHVLNHPTFITEGGVWLWSAHCTQLLLAGLVLLLVGPWVARQIRTGPESEGHKAYVTKNRFAHMIEVIAFYLRDKVVEPLLHERTNRFMPFLWTLFFFILVNNLIGLIPLLDINHLLFPGMKKDHSAFIGGTATQNLWVTAMLATVSAIVINIAGIKELGLKGYLAHLTAGTKPPVSFLLIPIEIAGIFIKPVALAIRLFANMTAGHILLATLFMFCGLSWAGGAMVGAPVTLVSAVAAVAIMFLELFVAFLQAFVFMFLTTVFISMLSHHGDHEHGHAEAAHAR